MFGKHPKGLISASLSNLGERFGFYTMMAILVLFLQAKFGLTGKGAGYIYSTFYFSIYILSLVGGIIADRTKKYKATIFMGLVLMALGYVILAIPTPTPVPNRTLFLVITCLALFIIAFGNGLFKGNLQALVGQMYDNPKYSNMRDSGFSLFYMFINIGAVIAPIAAVGVRNWWLSFCNYKYNADLPALCHQYISHTMTPEAVNTYNSLIEEATLSSKVLDPGTFAHDYLNVFTEGFHYAFAVAILAMVISLVIFTLNMKKFPDPSKAKNKEAVSSSMVEMDVQEIKQRMLALFAVFGVVIFFWFSFHQNGLTLTFFAKEYTHLELFGMPISAELFQSLNPFFVVSLTPVVMAIFAWQRRRGKEPSTPKKIAIGMGIAAFAFLIMAVGSYFSHLPLHQEVIEKGESVVKVTPFLLIFTYLVLTVAELYISPLGISFVSKVAPAKYQGIMQGGWLGATALGNQLLVIGAILYESIPIWMTWSVFVIACCISMGTMIVMLKWLERITRERSAV